MKYILICLLILISGCAQLGIQPGGQANCPELKSTPLLIEAPADFKTTIAFLEPIAQGKEKEAAEANLNLSLLHSHYKNPEPDYIQALAYLERYVKLTGKKQFPQVRDRLVLLRQINSILDADKKSSEVMELMRQDNRTLMLENQSLKDENKTLSNENLAMKQILERLNQVEMQHEKKRQQIK